MPASTLLQEHELVRNVAFGARVRTAITRVAREVLAEDPATPGNPLRVALARGTLSPGDYTTPGRAGVIAADPAISAAAAASPTPDDPQEAQKAITDEQILTAVRAAWNTMAGLSTYDLAHQPQ
ncbi:hypothetical protein [Streptomyces subrutilus]|uniref:Uncharacterized protein n=1 Tax=Streptomyces subrutilus TaxID=36818 RepID=A0A1E5NXL2_9ACTN|nr:hypothetical protein [Streptomyces subrutilus]OEJ20999.1 hypothetical protein BGK67_34450 [Streptomyces subrutilus]